MYKTIVIEHNKGGYEIQRGKTELLENIINQWEQYGYELISITPIPYLVSAARVSFILVFKTVNK